jgi:hypothetical protein
MRISGWDAAKRSPPHNPSAVMGASTQTSCPALAMAADSWARLIAPPPGVGRDGARQQNPQGLTALGWEFSAGVAVDRSQHGFIIKNSMIYPSLSCHNSHCLRRFQPRIILTNNN